MHYSYSLKAELTHLIKRNEFCKSHKFRYKKSDKVYLLNNIIILLEYQDFRLETNIYMSFAHN